MALTRRRVLQGLAAGYAASAPVAARPEVLAPLGALAATRGLHFASAIGQEVFNDPDYAGLIALECRGVATENALKFDWLRPNGPDADYTAADRLVSFAASRGLRVRGHALIWNDWLPDWLKRLGAQDIAALFDRHIEETVSRYAGRAAMWDVVNEPFLPVQRAPGGYRKGAWFEAIGPAYVERAFRRAARADPHAHLILNEAFCEQDDDWGGAIRPKLLALVRSLKESGVPLHGVGFQGHLKPHLPHDYRAFAAYCAQMAELGVAIHITELDVDDSRMPDDHARRDAAVAAALTAFLEPVLKVPALRSITVWQLSDRYSWYRNADHAVAVGEAGGNPARAPRTHLFDETLKPKAAALALRRAIAGSAGNRS